MINTSLVISVLNKQREQYEEELKKLSNPPEGMVLLNSDEIIGSLKASIEFIDNAIKHFENQKKFY